MFNIHVVRDETDVTGAGDWNDDDYIDAPTKALIFHMQFLDNTGARTLAHVLAQMGSVLQVKDKKQGLIADYDQTADLYYYLWYFLKRRPKIQGHSTDNDVGTITLALMFGHWLKPYQGLNARGLTTKLTSPASANSIDSEKLSIFQLTQPNAKYTEFIKHEKVAFTPTSAGWKKLPLFVTPLNKRILLALLYQTTGRDDVATTLTTTLEEIEFWADGVKRIGGHNAEFWTNLFAPDTHEAGNAYEAGLTFPSTYVPIDFTKLNGGRPLIPAEHGITRTLKMNIYGGDANAVRLNQYSILRA